LPKFEERPVPKISGKGPAGVNEFYKILGWREGLAVDREKIAMHPNDYAGICLELSIIEDPEARVLALSAWLFCGPKTDSSVPQSTVRLYPGCFRTKHTA
jgi:hypothetical protein